MAEEENKSSAEGFLDAVVAEKSGGEVRPQQLEMVRAVETAVEKQEHLLIQAGTGVGKTLGYLVPMVASGQSAIISTATNQLSQQIFDKDLPVVSELSEKVLNKPLNYAIVKGRANYLCKAKMNDLSSLDSGSSGSDLFEDAGQESPYARTKAAKVAQEFQELYKWADETETGDRAEAPAVSDDTWRSVSMTSAECPGRSSCPFGSECFAELARDKAQVADIVVTNHALVGADLDSEGTKILGEKSVLVTDETHELENYLSSAWGTELTVKMLKDVVAAGRKASDASQHSDRAKLDELDEIANALEAYLEGEEPQRYVDGLPESLSGALNHARTTLAFIAARFGAKSEQEEGGLKMRLRLASSIAEKQVGSIDMLLQNDGEMVQWLQHVRIKKDTDIPTLYAAPKRVGPKLMQLLDENEITLVATSATITVGGSFDIPERNLALTEPLVDTITDQVKPPRPSKSLDVGTPFNYRKQGILYIPRPDDISPPVGKDRFDHSRDVRDFVVRAVQASRGRGLILSTKTDEARMIGEILRENVDTPVLIKGDMPDGRLVDAFKDDIHSTLVGTMGFWHGLDAPGETCSLVVIDKIPFAPMNDPLMSARQEDVASRGGNGFMDVYVASANIMLAQGMGRLIRNSADRGVVAILDSRLNTTAYGRAMQKSLPPMYRTSNQEQVIKSLRNI